MKYFVVLLAAALMVACTINDVYAQSLQSVRAQNIDLELALNKYLWDRTVFLKMTCSTTLVPQPEDPTVDSSTDKKRSATGTGFFISETGQIITAHHLLDVAYKEERIQVEDKYYNRNCNASDTKIDIYLDPNDAMLGSPPDYTDIPSRRNNTEKNDDVLFLKANVGVGKPTNLPFICVANAADNDETLNDDGFYTVGYGLLGGVTSPWKSEVALGDFGVGDGSNFRKFPAKVPDGMSGAAVVNSAGYLVGIIHGRTIPLSGADAESLMIPISLFNGTARSVADRCSADHNTDTQVFNTAFQIKTQSRVLSNPNGELISLAVRNKGNMPLYLSDRFICFGPGQESRLSIVLEASDDTNVLPNLKRTIKYDAVGVDTETITLGSDNFARIGPGDLSVPQLFEQYPVIQVSCLVQLSDNDVNIYYKFLLNVSQSDASSMLALPVGGFEPFSFPCDLSVPETPFDAYDQKAGDEQTADEFDLRTCDK